jgi:hypothetical protein
MRGMMDIQVYDADEMLMYAHCEARLPAGKRRCAAIVKILRTWHTIYDEKPPWEKLWMGLVSDEQGLARTRERMYTVYGKATDGTMWPGIGWLDI